MSDVLSNYTIAVLSFYFTGIINFIRDLLEKSLLQDGGLVWVKGG